MDWKIRWKTRELDEIELVYEKAEKNPAIGKLLEQLETQALEEVKSNLGMIKTDTGTYLKPEQFDSLPETDKEILIKLLGGAGIASLNNDMQTATITIRLSALITKVQACTVFNILNRIEKLDGAVTVLKPKWMLKLQVPLGGKKGLIQWEMLIMQLYPWLSVQEESTNDVAVSKEKPSAQDPFVTKMSQFKAYTDAYALAVLEVENAIKNKLDFLSTWKDNLSLSEWKVLNDNERFSRVLSLGLFGIVIDNCVCVDFSEDIPNCIAIGLLFLADSGKAKKQLIDAGDGTDTQSLVNALTALHGCCSNWECIIAHPVFVKIGGTPDSTGSSLNQKVNEKPEKKSFWKRLFG